MRPKFFWAAIKLLLITNWPESGYMKGYFNDSVMYVLNEYIKAGFGLI